MFKPIDFSEIKRMKLLPMPPIRRVPFKYWKTCPLCEAGFKKSELMETIIVRDVSDPKNKKLATISHHLMEEARAFCSRSNDPIRSITDIKVDRINGKYEFTVLKRKETNNEKS